MYVLVALFVLVTLPVVSGPPIRYVHAYIVELAPLGRLEARGSQGVVEAMLVYPTRPGNIELNPCTGNQSSRQARQAREELPLPVRPGTATACNSRMERYIVVGSVPCHS